MFCFTGFTSLDGTTEAQGDLSSIVLHSLKVTHAKNGFPVSVGAKVFGVDHNSYASTGEAFSVIRELLPLLPCLCRALY